MRKIFLFILSVAFFCGCKRAHYYCYCEGGGKKSAIVDNYGKKNKRPYEKICDKHLSEGYTDCKLVQ